MQSHFLNMTACCQLLTDILESRKDVVHLSNPYQKCPVYETSSFLLRLVQLDDAKDLLACYSDRRAVANMNADCCTSDFYYETLTQMQECIRFWLREYQQQAYIRFAIIDKTVKKAVGTAEIFGGTLGGGLSGFGVLRIDLALPYETAPSLIENCFTRSQSLDAGLCNFYSLYKSRAHEGTDTCFGKTRIYCVRYIPPRDGLL